MICAPEAQISCYTGPPGTQDVGVCKSGAQICNAQGTGFGLCEGEITPTSEACITPEDDDCDGTSLNADGGCVCVPNTASKCYSGPAGTQNVGNCKGGISTCNASGTAQGPCFGEIVAVAEDCMTPEDDDCDGTAPSCGGDEVWAKRFGDAASQVAKGVAVQPDGTSFFTGYMHGSANFGNGLLTSSGSSDVFLAKLGAGGGSVWAKRFGDSGNQEGRGVAVNTIGTAAITGYFSGSVDFGGGTLTSAGSNDIFVARLNSAGNHVWSKSFGNNSNQYGNAVAFTSDDEIVIAGHMGGTVDFGGGVLTGAGGADAFLARFGADGSPKWSKIFGDAGNQYACGVAVAPTGNIILAGYFGGQIDLGAGQLSTAGLDDIFLASFSPNGKLVWSKRFGDGNVQYAYAVAVDATSGNIAVTGSFAGSVNFGGGVLSSAGGNDIYVAGFTASGAHVFSKRFGDAAEQIGNGVTFDAQGNVIVTGSFAGSNDTDVFLAKLSGVGTLLWTKTAGAAGAQSGFAVAADSANHVFVAGGLTGSVDFGGGALFSSGAEDAFLAKLLP